MTRIRHPDEGPFRPEPRGVVCDDLFSLLVRIAKTAHEACDTADERKSSVSIPRAEYDALCAALDALDTLPEVPGSASDGWHKAEYWSGRALSQHARAHQEAGSRDYDPTRILG